MLGLQYMNKIHNYFRIFVVFKILLVRNKFVKLIYIFYDNIVRLAVIQKAFPCCIIF